jgi:hypothetical protein
MPARDQALDYRHDERDIAPALEHRGEHPG